MESWAGPGGWEAPSARDVRVCVQRSVAASGRSGRRAGHVGALLGCGACVFGYQLRRDSLRGGERMKRRDMLASRAMCIHPPPRIRPGSRALARDVAAVMSVQWVASPWTLCILALLGSCAAPAAVCVATRWRYLCHQDAVSGGGQRVGRYVRARCRGVCACVHGRRRGLGWDGRRQGGRT